MFRKNLILTLLSNIHYGSKEDPLQTTLVRFKGPAAQKTFITGHSNVGENDGLETWTGYETQSSIFTLTKKKTSTAPPITTDLDLLWKFRLVQDGQCNVRGQLRIADYLNPTDKLCFEARNRAVSLQDYT